MKTAEDLFKIITHHNLYPYQKQLLYETHDRIIINKSRQIGISSFFAYYSLIHALTGKKVLIVSPSERQSLNFFDYVKSYFFTLTQYLNQNPAEITQAGYIEFINRGSIRSLPNSPQTIRGYKADIIIADEFAHIENDREIWESIFPMLTRGGRIILISTPKGEGNLFYEIWHNAELYGFKRYLINYRDCPDITPQRIEEIRRSMDEFSFRQEYENEFLGSREAVFPIDLIDKVTDKALSYWTYPEQIDPDAMLVVGVDVGRKHDKTAIVGVSRHNEVKFISTLENAPFKEQRDFIAAIAERAKKIVIDETGIGMQLAEELSSLFPHKVERVTMTNKTKLDGFINLRRLMEQGEITLPYHAELRKGLNMIERRQSQNTITYDAPRTDETGHSDLAFALMLAVYKDFRGAKFIDVISYDFLEGIK